VARIREIMQDHKVILRVKKIDGVEFELWSYRSSNDPLTAYGRCSSNFILS